METQIIIIIINYILNNYINFNPIQAGVFWNNINNYNNYKLYIK